MCARYVPARYMFVVQGKNSLVLPGTGVPLTFAVQYTVTSMVGDETLVHISLHCSFSSAVWAGVIAAPPFALPLPNGQLSNWWSTTVDRLPAQEERWWEIELETQAAHRTPDDLDDASGHGGAVEPLVQHDPSGQRSVP
jgi:hypothetical protein